MTATKNLIPCCPKQAVTPTPEHQRKSQKSAQMMPNQHQNVPCIDMPVRHKSFFPQPPGTDIKTLMGGLEIERPLKFKIFF